MEQKDDENTEPSILEEKEVLEESSHFAPPQAALQNLQEMLPSEKEIITESLEQRPDDSPNQSSVNLEFGDIIEIIAPTHPEIDEMAAIITYIDNQQIKLVNVGNFQHHKLTINEDGTFTD